MLKVMHDELPNRESEPPIIESPFDDNPTPVKLFKKTLNLVISLEIEIRGTENEIVRSIEAVDGLEFDDLIENEIWQEVEEDGTHHEFTVNTKRSDTKVFDNNNLEKII